MKMILLSLVMLLIAFEPAFSGKILKKLDKELKKMGLRKLQIFLADIDNNALDIQTKADEIDSNVARIDNNAMNIGDVQNNIGVIQNEIDSNTAHINNNTMDIGNNTLDIGTNANKIDSNKAHIDINAVDIGDVGNDITNEIASNLAKFNSITAEISNMDTTLDSHDLRIADNSANIVINTANIAKNAADIVDSINGDCNVYNILDDAKRSRNYNNDNGLASPSCDSSTVEGDWKGGDSWYRFQEPAGTQLADSIVPKSHCGAGGTGWLNGAHPVVLGENVIRKVCFSWIGTSCTWNANVEIKNCGGYYLYKFKETPVCDLKYCGQ